MQNKDDIGFGIVCITCLVILVIMVSCCPDSGSQHQQVVDRFGVDVKQLPTPTASNCFIAKDTNGATWYVDFTDCKMKATLMFESK